MIAHHFSVTKSVHDWADYLSRDKADKHGDSHQNVRDAPSMIDGEDRREKPESQEGVTKSFGCHTSSIALEA